MIIYCTSCENSGLSINPDKSVLVVGKWEAEGIKDFFTYPHKCLIFSHKHRSMDNAFVVIMWCICGRCGRVAGEDGHVHKIA